MKKSSLFVIAVVCVLAIVIITFFGQAVEMGQFRNPIKTITVTNEKVGNSTIVADFDYKSSDPTIVYLHVTTAPANADDPNAYRFMLVDDGSSTSDEGTSTSDDGASTSVDGSNELEESSDTTVANYVKVEIDETYGYVYFFEPAFVKVRIVATDGGGASTEVYVWCRGNETA